MIAKKEAWTLKKPEKILKLVEKYKDVLFSTDLVRIGLYKNKDVYYYQKKMGNIPVSSIVQGQFVCKKSDVIDFVKNSENNYAKNKIVLTKETIHDQLNSIERRISAIEVLIEKFTRIPIALPAIKKESSWVKRLFSSSKN